MTDNRFEELSARLEQNGAEAAIDQLCDVLRETKDYHNLFYALLMKKRHELGVSPVPTAPAQQLPEKHHQEYEQAILHAARTVGELFLKDNNIPGAFAYFNMINERDPIVQALDETQPSDEEDVEALVNIAYHQGIHPRKGFDLILDRFGICSAITTLGGHQFPFGDDVRDYCVKRVVRALYDELKGRLRAEIQAQEGIAPPESTPVSELIQGRFWLFADELYHVDVSHLGAAVQMSINLEPGPELQMAREMCAYGDRLSSKLKYASEPPFEDQYKDYGVYLSILAGENVEEGLDYFRKKIEDLDPDEYGTFPAETMVNLLLRAGREEEALEVASKYLVNVDERQLTCPGIVELCERTGNYEVLADLAKKHNNLVHYMAGLIAAKEGSKTSAEA